MVTNAVNVTPAASPAPSGRTSARVSTVVKAYTSPIVKPHAVLITHCRSVAVLPSSVAILGSARFIAK
jgi:hypothetical protein